MNIFSRIALLLLALIATPAAAAGIEVKWQPPSYPIPAGTVRLAERGVLPDDADDVAERINAVLATLHEGDTLYLQPGIYRIGKTLLIPSGVALQGPQDANGHPLAVLAQVRPFGKWGPLSLGLLMNRGYQSATIADRRIRITAVAFRHDSTGVLLRKVEDVTIEGCSFTGGGDATAILGGRRTLVTHSLSVGTRNAAFDHWNGTDDATVTDSIAIVQQGHGILFNAVDTDYTPRTARNFTATRNTISGVGKDAVGIWVSPLGRGGGNIAGTITIADNHIGAPQPGARAAGILVNAGTADLVAILRNTVTGVNDYAAITVGPNRPVEGGTDRLPARVVVEGNEVRDNKVSRSAGGVLRLWGDLVTAEGNILSQNRFVDGATAPAMSLCARKSPAVDPLEMACGLH